MPSSGDHEHEPIVIVKSGLPDTNWHVRFPTHTQADNYFVSFAQPLQQR